MSDSYQKPLHGWTCFHCGETFKTVGAARDHFGFEPSSDLACRIKLGDERGLVMALRKAEAKLAIAQAEVWEEAAKMIEEWRRDEPEHVHSIGIRIKAATKLRARAAEIRKAAQGEK